MGTPLRIWGCVLVEQPSKGWGTAATPGRLPPHCFPERMAHLPVPLAPWEDACPAALLSLRQCKLLNHCQEGRREWEMGLTVMPA